MIKKYIDGAWAEPTNAPKRIQDGAWVECETLNRYDTDNAAWVPVWENYWAKQSDGDIILTKGADYGGSVGVSPSAGKLSWAHKVSGAITYLFVRIPFKEPLNSITVSFDYDLSGEAWSTSPLYTAADQLKEFRIAKTKDNLLVSGQYYTMNQSNPISASDYSFQGTASYTVNYASALSEMWICFIGGNSSVCQGSFVVADFTNFKVNGNEIKLCDTIAYS